MSELTGYELQRALESIPALVAKVPALISRELQETCESTIPDVIARINRTIEACKTFEETLSAREEELCQQIDATYARVAKAHHALREKIEALPKLPERMNLPYNLKDLLDFTDRCERISPETWLRVIAIAEACGEVHP